MINTDIELEPNFKKQKESAYIVEKNIPYFGSLSANSQRWENYPYPFAAMEVGDSFLVPVAKVSERQKKRRQLCQEWLAWRNHYAKRERKFRSAQMDGGIRVWRIE